MNRHGWTYKKLGDVTTKISDGSHNPPKGIDYSEYPMLSSKNVFFDCFNYDSPRYLSKEEFDLENKRTDISDGDILLTIVGTVGRTCCVKNPFIPFVLQRSVAVLKPKRSIIESRFLMYALHSLSDFWNIEAKGVAQKGIYLKQLATVPIPVPPLAEQKRIVAELDLLSGIIDKKKEQLKAYDQLAQSIFYTMFGDPIDNPKGWEYNELIQLYRFIDYRGKTPNKKTEGIPLITAKNIRKGTIDHSVAEYISESEHKNRLTRGIPQKGDLLFTTEAPLGNAAIADLDIYATAQRLIVLQKRENALLNNNYVLYYILSDIFQEELLKQATGSTIKGIKGSKLEKIRIPFPPLSLQQEFAEKVEAIERQKALVQQSIVETQTMFDYTMDKYFG
jgi:type I restriction enzyme S subunit